MSVEEAFKAQFTVEGGAIGAANRALGNTAKSSAYPELSLLAQTVLEAGPLTAELLGQAIELVGEAMCSSLDAPKDKAEEIFVQVLMQQPLPLACLALLVMESYSDGESYPLGPLAAINIYVVLQDKVKKKYVQRALDGHGEEIFKLPEWCQIAVWADFGTAVKNSIKAQLPRPKKKPTFKSEFTAAMRISRREGMALLDFIESVRAGSLEHLSIEDGPRGVNGYMISADAVNDGEPTHKSHHTLNDWFKSAGKG